MARGLPVAIMGATAVLLVGEAIRWHGALPPLFIVSGLLVGVGCTIILVARRRGAA